MPDTKISGATALTGSGAVSTPVARAGSTTAYRRVDNLAATADPSATDDSGSGYHVGSMWFRSDTCECFMCLDATSTAAVWVKQSIGYHSPSKRFYTFNDFMTVTNATGNNDWQSVVSGTGATSDSVTIAALNAIGILALTLGTTTTGRAAVWSGSVSGNSGNGSIKLGSGAARWTSKAAIHVLSDGTETYTTRMGFLDSVQGESTDGVFFRYSHSVNGGKWQAVTRSNGTETATDTGVTVVADAWKKFEIEVDAAASSVVFKIDGTIVATNTTNIPSGSGRELAYGIMALKSAGTTSVTCAHIDYAEVEYLFTTAR